MRFVFLLWIHIALVQSSFSAWKMKPPRPSTAHETARNGIPNSARKKSAENELAIKMREILTNDLQYTEDEARRMDPEIARIVIQKSLMRPMRGMPTAWDINAKSRSGFDSSSLSRVVTTMNSVLSAFRDDRIVYALFAAGSMYGLTTVFPHQLLRRLSGPRKSSRNGENQLDLRELDRLYDLGMFDKFKIAVDAIKNKII